LDINILSAPMVNGNVGNWNDRIFYDSNNIAGVVWNDYSMLIADCYIDASVIEGASYHQLQLWADSNSLYYQPICSRQPDITAGQQAVTWTIDFKAGAIPVDSPLKDIFLILNADTTNGTGHIYINNMRLVYKVCPTPTP
jgi:hypothetical protein